MSEILNLNNNQFDFHSEHGEEVRPNIYGKVRFLPEHARERVDSLASDFKDFFGVLGYKEIRPIEISSGFDDSVLFIGSHISVFKPYLTEDNLPEPGVYMCQDCLRVRNANKLLDDNYCPNLGSYFTSLGALASPERLNNTCFETFVFFEKVLGIDKSNIMIRVSSADEDLLDACGQYYGSDNLEIDTKDPSYYSHRIGMEGIHGRSFNIALQDNNLNGFSDVGNIIVLENDEKKIGVEIALGATTILKQLYDLDHVQDCNPVIGLEKIKNESIRRKFEDAIATSVVLYNEGLRPFGKCNRNRILKKYVLSLGYFMTKSGMSFEDLEKVISDFTQRQLGPNSEVAYAIMESVKNLESKKTSR